MLPLHADEQTTKSRSLSIENNLAKMKLDSFAYRIRALAIDETMCERNLGFGVSFVRLSDDHATADETHAK